MSSLLLVLLVIIFFVQSLFTNIVANGMERLLNDQFASVPHGVRYVLYFAVWVTLTIPVAWITYREFGRQGAAPTFSPWFSVAAVIFLGVALSIVILRRVQRTPSRWYFVGFVSIVVSIIVIALFAFRLVRSETRTVFFLVDASSRAQDKLDEVQAVLDLQALRIPDRAEIAFAVYGSGLEGRDSCDDIVQLVAPSPKTEALRTISFAVDRLGQLGGHAYPGTQEAILFAIRRLPATGDKHQIFVITSSPGLPCKELNFVELAAEAEGQGIPLPEISSFVLGPVEDVDRESVESVSVRTYVEDPEQDLEDQLNSAIQEVFNSPPVNFLGYQYYGY